MLENLNPSTHNTVALIVAGGSGVRMGGEIPKQYQGIYGVSMLRKTVEIFLKHLLIDSVCVVIRPEDDGLYKQSVSGLELLPPVYGGDKRQESVLRGLEDLGKYNPDYVLIHDAARPFVSDNLINDVVNKLGEVGAVVPAMPEVDTVKEVVAGKITRTLDRGKIVKVQTPQGFHYNDILAAHREMSGNDFSDDAAVIEAVGGEVAVTAGSPHNIKITTSEDLIAANKRAGGMKEIRVGQGYDVHAFSSRESGGGKKFIKLCGVEVSHGSTLSGHSDADVGLHALVDAILGAIGEGDIGQHFPPSDDKWKDADSSVFVAHAIKLMQGHGGEISNIDITIICESPKISPHREEMRARVAELCEVKNSRVNIKATTTEGLGFTGRAEGIAAQAIVTIMLPEII